MVNNHRHHFTIRSYSGSNIQYRCRCEEERERKMDREEQQRFKIEYFPKAKDSIHRVELDFYDRFRDKKADRWKYVGWDFMERARKWAAKHPGDVRLVGCDDGSHSSSLLVLIERRAADAYMGTTVVYIPQCTGEPPSNFFLYPSNRGSFIAALREIKREAAPREKREHKVEAERAKWWASRPKP